MQVVPKALGVFMEAARPKCMGGAISKNVIIYSSAKIFDPRTLIMEEGSEIGPNCELYNIDYIILKKNSIVSQYAYLCTSSHEISDMSRPLIFKPIILEEDSWVAAKAIVGMGVTIGQGAIVGLGSTVTKDISPWTVVGGNPAKMIKQRTINKET